MRFETSQTTPSFLDRRIQLRMLSFVGMISIAMFFLATTTRPSAKHGPKPATSPDSLRFEPIAENRTLKPDEVIILATNEHSGPRGQLRNDADEVSPAEEQQPHDWDLFKSRAQERQEELRFFRQRDRHVQARPDNGLTDRREKEEKEIEGFPEPVSVSLEEHAATEERALDQEEVVQQPDWDEQPALPPSSKKSLPDKRTQPETRSDEDQNGILSDLLFRKRADEEEKKSLLPDEFDRETEKFEPPVRPRKELPSVKEPLREPESARKREREIAPAAPPSKKRTRHDIATISPDPSFDIGNEVPPKSNPLRQAPQKSSPNEEYDSFDQFTSDAPRSNPIAPRREPSYSDDEADTPRAGRDLYLDDEPAADSGSEPFQQKYAAVEIEKRYLDMVKDNTMGIRKDEAESFYWLLDHARRVPSRSLESKGLKEVQYINLMTEPDRFRGEPVTIEGDLWRLYEFDAGENSYGVNRVYEGWVFTGDSANHPYRIVCTGLPKGIEPGENLRVPVRLTGYFFKLEGFRSNGGVHIAPTMLARRIKINPMPNGIPLMSGVVPYLLGAIMAVGIALLVTTVGFAIGDERSMRGLVEQRRRHPSVSFANVTTPSLVPIEQALRQFAERERQTAISGAYGPLMTRQTVRSYGLKEGATSAFETDHRQEQQQHNAVHDWIARQKATAAESQTATAKKQHHKSLGDELESSVFEVARHRVTVSQPVLTPESRSSSGTGHTFNSSQTILNPPPLAQAQAVSNASSRPSALAEWEAEANRLTHHIESHSHHGHASAAEQIERDHLAREREIRQRIARQQAESARVAQEQLERERLEVERLERERQWFEKQERERVERERSSFRDADRDSTQYSLDTSHSVRSTDHVEQERLRHEFNERERLERQRIERDVEERERRERERVERERLEHERMERERRVNLASHQERPSSLPAEYSEEFEDESPSPSHESNDRNAIEDDEPHVKKRRGGGWGWPQRRKSSPSSETTTSSTDGEETKSHESTGKRRGGWGWPRRRKNEADVESTELNDQTASDDDSSSDDSGGGSGSYGWGRGRKRRRNFRDNEST